MFNVYWGIVGDGNFAWGGMMESQLGTLQRVDNKFIDEQFAPRTDFHNRRGGSVNRGYRENGQQINRTRREPHQTV